MLPLLALLAAAEPAEPAEPDTITLPTPTPAPWLEPPATASGSPCELRDPDGVVLGCGGAGWVRAYGDDAALVGTSLGTFVVTAKGGVTRGVEGRVVGLGSGNVPYQLDGGRLLRDGRDTGIAADRARVVPGYTIVVHGGRVTVRTEPGGAVVTQRDATDVVDIAVTSAGVAVVAINTTVPGVPGLPLGDPASHPRRTLTAAVFLGGRWSEIPRPEGKLEGVGAQVRVGRKALDRTGRHWEAVGEVDTGWWAAQTTAGSGPPAAVAPSTSYPTARRPVPPEPPPPPPPETHLTLGKRSLLLQMIGTSGNASGDDAVVDILGDDAAGWSVLPPRRRDPRTELLLLADGVRAPAGSGAVWARTPHALLVDFEADTKRLLSVPTTCDPLGAWSVAGLQLLTCAGPDGAVVYARVGDAWVKEPVLLPAAAPSAYPSAAEDGTLLFLYGDTAWVRTPHAPGRAGWRSVPAAATSAWPGPAGSLLLLTLAAPTLELQLVLPGQDTPVRLLRTDVPEAAWYLRTEAGRVLLFGHARTGEVHLVQWPPLS